MKTSSEDVMFVLLDLKLEIYLCVLKLHIWIVCFFSGYSGYVRNRLKDDICFLSSEHYIYLQHVELLINMHLPGLTNLSGSLPVSPSQASLTC